MTYTTLRDFLDGYTNDEGVIQGDPSIIAAEAVAAGLVGDDAERLRQHPDEYVATQTGAQLSEQDEILK